MPEIILIDTVGQRLNALLDFLGSWAAKGKIHPDSPGLDRDRHMQVLWRRHDNLPLVRIRLITEDNILVDAVYDLREVNDKIYLIKAGVSIDKYIEEKRRKRAGAPDPMQPKKLLVPRQVAEAAEAEGVDHDKMREWSESIVDKIKVA